MTPRERAVMRAGEVFEGSTGYSPLWTALVDAWTVAYEATDLLREDQWGSDYRENSCHSCGNSERSGHQDDCRRAAVLGKVER